MDPNPATEIIMSIGENIRRKREMLEMSQKALAEAIDSGENTVSGWEKGKNPPPGDKVAAMARLFGCSTDEILLDDHERNMAPEMTALFRRFSDLPAPLKPLARGVIGAALGALEEEAIRSRSA
ncbi:hypothetical protein PAGU2196_25080 [Pseudomonas sp. PAGU 2196]|uniref:helix-turn-helix domain-containing protein n=1 Tax=Pseudomonas sp. PAGU 2196 TaxID=2793997 RepID=UPI001EE12BF2|nr:helix-turn-helix transcriptional regulator [Pseudomonas sp. PAGU 2196]GHS81674.1 hypothetical protein PAGU2196_25080 [Pseudomonas sp. PAGU 2196]